MPNVNARIAHYKGYLQLVNKKSFQALTFNV